MSNPKQPVTCADCQHASWQRTPTGRIRRNTCGSCAKERELLSSYTFAKHPPCLVIGRVNATRIWPNDDASGCPMWLNKAASNNK